MTETIIRDAFNRAQIFEGANRGELRARVFGYNTHLSRRQRRLKREPRCTRSQMVLYATLDGRPVALVHQYRRPDGTFGGKGRPDPKRLFYENRVLAIRESP